MGDGFYRSKDPTNSIKVLKEMLQRTNETTKTTKYTYAQTIIETNKKAQLMLAYPRDAKTMKKFLHFEVITSSSQVGNLVFIVIKFLIQITSTYNNS